MDNCPDDVYQFIKELATKDPYFMGTEEYMHLIAHDKCCVQRMKNEPGYKERQKAS